MLKFNNLDRKECENCLMAGTNTPATKKLFVENAFGNIESRNVNLCNECYKTWKEV